MAAHFGVDANRAILTFAPNHPSEGQITAGDASREGWVNRYRIRHLYLSLQLAIRIEHFKDIHVPILALPHKT